MILKNTDNKDSSIAALEGLIATAPAPLKSTLEQELRILRAGIKGEQESAYLIDFDYGESKNNMVIHDLRIEAKGRVAQIDHLIINRLLDVLVLETKHFHAGIKISEEGEFLRWNGYKKTYEGMASPLAQNDRHIQVLKDAFGQIEMPKRLGVRLAPCFHSYILVAPNARIDRPKKFDTSNVIKADVLRSTWLKDTDEASVLDGLGGLAKLVSRDTLLDIGRRLVALHKPIRIDYAGKFGAAGRDAPSLTRPAVAPTQPAEPPRQDTPVGHICRACGNGKLTIQYGKYGYYFKCPDCDGNTPIKLGCGVEGHKERIRKEGRQFFRECAECKSSRLYFQNP